MPINRSNSEVDSSGCDPIATALTAVLEQSHRSEFEIAPCLNAIELLETLPPADTVDDRVQLALEVTRCLGSEWAALGMRALSAAKPIGARISDPHKRRKWLSFSGVLEIRLGNPSAATAHLAAALELAIDLEDTIGICSVWNNLSLLASGAGQYEDVVRYTSLAITAVEGRKNNGSPAFAEILAPPYLNRAEALFRLGRLDDALSDAANAFAYSMCSVGHASQMVVLTQRTTAFCLLASLRTERGELVQAEVLLHFAETFLRDVKASEMARLSIQCAKGELLAARGHVQEATELLECTLVDATAFYASSVCGDSVMDTLHALQRLCRTTNQADKADTYLSKIGERLRANADRALVALSAVPHVTVNGRADPAQRMRNVDRYLSEVAGVHPFDVKAVTSLQYLASIAASASATEESSGEHGVRVACLCGHVARALGLEPRAVQTLEQAALVHDLGKIGVPASVLTKSEVLTEHEFNLVEGHVDYGAQLIERSTLVNRNRLAELVRLHHLPFHSDDARCVTSIPIEARILSACDRFDALITGRPRRAAVSVAEGLRVVLEMSARELDPLVVDVLIETVRALQRQQDHLIDFLARAADDYDYTSARRRLRRAAEGAKR